MRPPRCVLGPFPREVGMSAAVATWGGLQLRRVVVVCRLAQGVVPALPKLPSVRPCWRPRAKANCALAADIVQEKRTFTMDGLSRPGALGCRWRVRRVSGNVSKLFRVSSNLLSFGISFGQPPKMAWSCLQPELVEVGAVAPLDADGMPSVASLVTLSITPSTSILVSS